MPWLLLFLTAAAWAHAPIAPVLQGPFRVEGARLLSAAGAPVQLRGAAVPTLDAATAPTLGVLRIRWNGNSVRIPVNAADWRRDGQAYLNRVTAAVRRANDAELAVVLAAGDADDAFAAAIATTLRDVPNLLFSLRATGEWAAWRAEMERALAAIRAAGSRHVVALSAASFAGIPPEFLFPGESVIYEARPAVSATALAAFGTLPGRVPLYAGEWGLTDCAALPADARAASDTVFQNLYDFDDRAISWTAATFTPGSLLLDTAGYEPSRFTSDWRCGQPGMGETLLSWVTGDPIGFGYLRREAIASAAGGPATPVAPGQLLSLYIEQMGPTPDAFGALDASRRLPLTLGGTEVFFDGQPVPILFAGQYQINVQAPPALTPGRDATVQVFFRGVPSNRASVPIVAAAPELFHDIFTKNVLALNENGTRNTPANPASTGSIVVFFGTGMGATSPAAAAGLPAPSPHPLLAQPAAVFIDGQQAQVLFAGEIPGFIGLAQVNARLPEALPPGALPVTVRVANRQSQAGVLLSVR